MSTNRRTGKNPNLIRRGRVTPSAQSHQSGQPSNHDPSFVSGSSELSVGPPRSPPLAPTIYEVVNPRPPGHRCINSSRSYEGPMRILDVQIEGGETYILTPFSVQAALPAITGSWVSVNQDGSRSPRRPRQHRTESLPPGSANGEVIGDSDDLIVLSPPSYQQARSSRTQRTPATNVERVEESSRNQRRRVDLDLQPPFVDFMGTGSSMLQVEPVAPLPSPPPSPPSVPTYTCPICLGPMDEESTATKCGHIFCDGCIRMAISSQGRCPVCQCNLTHQSLLKIFLPALK